MNEPEFSLIDNNCTTKSGTLLKWLKKEIYKCNKLNIASAFFYNILNSSSNELDIFQYILKNNFTIKINLILSDRISEDIKRILSAWIEKKDLVDSSEKNKRFLEVLNQLDLIIFILNNDLEGNSRFFHPKLYLLENNENPIAFFLGSSNLTSAGLSDNIELNLFETEPKRCIEFKKWFDKIKNIAKPISIEILDKICPIPDVDYKNSCEVSQKEKIIKKLACIKLIQLDQSLQNMDVSYDEKQKTLELKGMVLYDYDSGIHQSIELNEMIAWAIGKIDSFQNFKSLNFIKIAEDDQIQAFFEVFDYKQNIHWIGLLRNSYRTLPKENRIKFDNESYKDVYIQILINNGNLYQEKINL